jgi:hypothetical protein
MQLPSRRPKIVTRAAAALPATAQTAYFTVVGRVIVTALVGEVTTTIQDQDCNLDIWANPTVGDDVALCAVNNIKTDAVGTMYSIDGVAANALIAATSGAIFPGTMIPAQGLIVAAGTIDIKTSATNTGATKWTIQYIPLDPGSYIVTA